MIDFTKTYQLMSSKALSPWLDQLPQQMEKSFQGNRWGDLPKWKNILDQLPELKPSRSDFNSNHVAVLNHDHLPPRPNFGKISNSKIEAVHSLQYLL